jgi:hypothetical protein
MTLQHVEAHVVDSTVSGNIATDASRNEIGRCISMPNINPLLRTNMSRCEVVFDVSPTEDLRTSCILSSDERFDMCIENESQDFVVAEDGEKTAVR